MKASRPGSLGTGAREGGSTGRKLSAAAEGGPGSGRCWGRGAEPGIRVVGDRHRWCGLTFLVCAAGHQGAVGALALGPVGAHLHLIVAIRVQVGELCRGHLAVKQVGFGLRVTLDPIFDLPPGEERVSG